uniref:Lig_chan-Glu_bd domain-containing protein n=1 Tax=Globodera pallida TaxID=36090 RepID=A0A183BI43_GLOPA
MEKRTIKVGFVKYPPAVFNSCSHFPELASRRKCPFPGHCVEFLRFVAEILNLTVEPIVLSQHKVDIDVGSRGADGQWHGVLGAIANGTVDTGCLFYQKTPPRIHDFDYTLPIYSTLSRIAIRDRNSSPLADMWRLFQPFAVGTWIAIAMFLALHTLAFMAIGKMELMAKFGIDRRGFMLHKVGQFGNVMFVQGDDPAYFLSAYFCDIAFVDREMPYRTAHFLFRRGSPFTERFNEVIKREEMAIRRSYDRYRMLREMLWNQECEEKMAKSRLYKPLSFVPMIGLLAVYGICTGIALIMFIVECAIGGRIDFRSSNHIGTFGGSQLPLRRIVIKE